MKARANLFKNKGKRKVQLCQINNTVFAPLLLNIQTLCTILYCQQLFVNSNQVFGMRRRESTIKNQKM
jgi:hypothetical protein